MGALFALLVTRWARKLAIRIALIGAVLLFLLNLRRAGETAGRAECPGEPGPQDCSCTHGQSAFGFLLILISLRSPFRIGHRWS